MSKSNTHFAPVPLTALSDNRLSHSDLRVLAALHYRANKKNGACFPSNEDIAELTRMHRRTVQRATARLVGFGYLLKVIHSGRTHANNYRLKDGNAATFSDDKRRQSRPEKVAIPSLKGGSAATPTEKEQKKNRKGSPELSTGLEEKDALPAWSRLPDDDTTLEAWASSHGYLPKPKSQTISDYRIFIESLARQKLKDHNRRKAGGAP